MIFVVPIVIVLVNTASANQTLHTLEETDCYELTNLTLKYGLNTKSATYDSIGKVLNIIRIQTNDVLNKTDFLTWLSDMCISQSLTMKWFLDQAMQVCPNAHMVRSLIEPSGVICHQDGRVTELTKQMLESFNHVNKSFTCEAALQKLQTACEIKALFGVPSPMYSKKSFASQLRHQTRLSISAIFCTLPQISTLPRECGRTHDLKIYQLIIELIQKQPFKLTGRADFTAFANLIKRNSPVQGASPQSTSQ